MNVNKWDCFWKYLKLDYVSHKCKNRESYFYIDYYDNFLHSLVLDYICPLTFKWISPINCKNISSLSVCGVLTVKVMNGAVVLPN